MIEENLLDAAGISRTHDGRHPKIWKLLLKSTSMETIVSYVYEVATASNFPTSWIISCDHGRHRSVATAILISLLFLYLGCSVDLEWHVYDAEHNGKECKRYRCVCQNTICHDPTVQSSLMNLWDACTLQTTAATYATAQAVLPVHKCAACTLQTTAATYAGAKEDPAVRKGAILPILSSASVLLTHGFDASTAAGYLNPDPGESVTIIFDGFWSNKQEDKFGCMLRTVQEQKDGFIVACF